MLSLCLECSLSVRSHFAQSVRSLEFDKKNSLYLTLFSFPFLLCGLVYSYRNTQIRASALTDQPLARLHGFQISLATV